MRKITTQFAIGGLVLGLHAASFGQGAAQLALKDYELLAQSATTQGITAQPPFEEVAPILYRDLLDDAPQKGLQDGKVNILLKYSWGRDYACEHGLELIQRLHQMGARSQIVHLFMPRDGCTLPACETMRNEIIDYFLALSKKPDAQIESDGTKGLIDAMRAFLWSWFDCTGEFRFLDALMNNLEVNPKQANFEDFCGRLCDSVDHKNVPKHVKDRAAERIRQLTHKRSMAELLPSLQCMLGCLAKEPSTERK